MTYVRKQDDKVLVKRPPTGMDAAAARTYLDTVKSELESEFGPAPSFKALQRIDLEDGGRGGYFSSIRSAMNELMCEAVDVAKSAKIVTA